MIIPYLDRNFKLYEDRIVLSKKPIRPNGYKDGHGMIWLEADSAITHIDSHSIAEDGKTVHGMFGNVDFACYFIEAEDAKRVETPSIDYVDHPSHYQTDKGIEVIDVIEAFTEKLTGVVAFDIGCALKYLCRWSKKNGVEDLRKAIWYLEHAIKKTEGAEDGSIHCGENNG